MCTTRKKSKFLKQRNFKPLKTQNFEGAKLNGFTVFQCLSSFHTWTF